MYHHAEAVTVWAVHLFGGVGHLTAYGVNI